MPTEGITSAILILRGRRVLLDSELAPIYGVETRARNPTVKRNAERFPEAAALSRSQTVIGSQKRRDLRFRPSAFTEHGAIMAATVLNTPCAVEMSIDVVRAFVQLREALRSNKELAERLDQLEARIEQQLATHDDAIAAMPSAIRERMHPPTPRRRGTGFTAEIGGK